MRPTVLTVVGARPQFIKSAAVSRANLKDGKFDEIVLHTGQHFDRAMSSLIWEELEVPPPVINLGVNRTHPADFISRLVGMIGEIVRDLKPQALLVYGDTDSTLAGSIAAVKSGTPLVHIEAGLRSFNRNMPEETNRVLTDHASDLLMCPTRTAMKHLANEGLGSRAIFVGDVMYDSSLWAQSQVKKEPNAYRVPGADKNCVVLTLHRKETLQDRFSLQRALSFVRETFSGRQIVFPAHPNTGNLIRLLGVDTRGISIMEPLSYLQMSWLLDHCGHVVTDSGGLQKEAFFFRKLCTTLRSETEWPETIESGWNTLWNDPRLPLKETAEFGDGEASTLAIESIRSFL